MLTTNVPSTRTNRDWLLPLLPLGISAVVMLGVIVWFHSVDQGGSPSTSRVKSKPDSSEFGIRSTERSPSTDNALRQPLEKLALASPTDDTAGGAPLAAGTDLALELGMEPLFLSEPRSRRSEKLGTHPGLSEMDQISDKSEEVGPDQQPDIAEMPVTDDSPDQRSPLREFPGVDRLVSDSEATAPSSATDETQPPHPPVQAEQRVAPAPDRYPRTGDNGDGVGEE
jgi:hypothetical protein